METSKRESRNCAITTKLKKEELSKVKTFAKKLGINQTAVVRAGVTLFLEQNSDLLENLSPK